MSLLELLLAVAIAGIVLASLMATLSAGLGGGASAQRLTGATFLASAVVDELRAGSFLDVVSRPAEPSSLNPFYTVSVNVTEVAYDLREVTVTVSWTELRGGARSVQLRTYVAAQGW